VEVPVPELTAATGSCGAVDSAFSLDYFGQPAFPRQTGQLYLEQLVADGLDAVYCEGESLRRERKLDGHHLTEFKLIEIEKRDMPLSELCDFQERVLKEVAGWLHADLIGGDNVTRLDRALHLEHPRLTYREVIRVLNRRGFTLEFGDDLDREAEASLTRYCDNLPVHVTHYPERLKFFNMKIDRTDPEVVECVDYILPFAGETFSGSVHESDHDLLRHRLETGPLYAHLMDQAQDFARRQVLTNSGDPKRVKSGEPGQMAERYRQGIRKAFDAYLSRFEHTHIERAGCGLGVARLLQFLLGLDSIKEGVVFPLDRLSFGRQEKMAAAG
jgi:aspartyl/asparaginyl-tRNA synthetase